MDRKFSLNKPQPVDHAVQATSLTTWIEATSTFYRLYNHLAAYTNQTCLHQLSSIQPIEGSPCSVEQVKILLGRMQTILNRLLNDIDLAEAPHLTYSKLTYRKLDSHSRILNCLNQEAQLLSQQITQMPR